MITAKQKALTAGRKSAAAKRDKNNGDSN